MTASTRRSKSSKLSSIPLISDLLALEPHLAGAVAADDAAGGGEMLPLLRANLRNDTAGKPADREQKPRTLAVEQTDIEDRVWATAPHACGHIAQHDVARLRCQGRVLGRQRRCPSAAFEMRRRDGAGDFRSGP